MRMLISVHLLVLFILGYAAEIKDVVAAASDGSLDYRSVRKDGKRETTGEPKSASIENTLAFHAEKPPVRGEIAVKSSGEGGGSAGDGGRAVEPVSVRKLLEETQLLEPLVLPPSVDVYPEVPDRVGETPLRVQTVVEADPPDQELELNVPWVWDDKVCSPLLSRPPPPAGPLTSDQVTFSLPLVVREGRKLKLRTRTGAVSPIHSEEAAAIFEKVFWCVTALIARVRDPDERTKLMNKLYKDYLLWMEEDVIPVFNSTDLKKAYRWIKNKDDNKWVVPEKRHYGSAQRRLDPREAGPAPVLTSGSESSDSSSRTVVIILVLVCILVVVIVCYLCLMKKKKLLNLSCFCVCERCRKRSGDRGPVYQEEERKPLTNQKNVPKTSGWPKQTYIYRSSSWSSNSSLQPPCNPLQQPCNKLNTQPPCP